MKGMRKGIRNYLAKPLLRVQITGSISAAAPSSAILGNIPPEITSASSSLLEVSE